MKRFLLILLSLVMVLSILPFSAVATPNSWDRPENKIECVFDYNDYEEYLYYNYYEGKEWYHIIDEINVYFKDDFMNRVDKLYNVYFPEIADEILKIERYKKSNSSNEEEYFKFTLAVRDKTNYTEEDIDHFIDNLLYIAGFEEVKEIYILLDHKLDEFCIEENIDPLDKLPDGWNDYNEYAFYETNETRNGFVTDCVILEFTDDFKNNYFDKVTIDAAFFPEIEDLIFNIECFESFQDYVLWFDEERYNYNNDEYTKEDLDKHFEILEYLANLDYIENIIVNFIVGVTLDPIITDTSDTNSEADTTEAVESTDTSVTTSTEETTTAEETTAATDEKKPLNNHQTGDEIFLYISVALVSAALISFVYALKQYKKSK